MADDEKQTEPTTGDIKVVGSASIQLEKYNDAFVKLKAKVMRHSNHFCLEDSGLVTTKQYFNLWRTDMLAEAVCSLLDEIMDLKEEVAQLKVAQLKVAQLKIAQLNMQELKISDKPSAPSTTKSTEELKSKISSSDTSKPSAPCT